MITASRLQTRAAIRNAVRPLDYVDTCSTHGLEIPCPSCITHDSAAVVYAGVVIVALLAFCLGVTVGMAIFA